MGIFAEITAGIVTNVAVAAAATHLPTGTWVQIDTLTPQPGIGWGYSGGAFTAPVVPVVVPTAAQQLAQQAAAAINAGLTITLSGSLTLAATLFPTDPVTTAKIGAVITTLLATGAFPGGTTSYPMKDATGAWHTFTAAQYPKVAGALAAYVAALDLIADGNPLGATELPANSATVALS